LRPFPLTGGKGLGERAGLGRRGARRVNIRWLVTRSVY
jgi:hypothetical protein